MQPDLKLRGATWADRELLLAWRNDPVTIQGCLTGTRVAQEEHYAWLRKSLVSGSRRLFIAEEDTVAIASVLLDYTSAGVELSWMVAPDARGRGIGKRLVGLAAEQASSLFTRIRSDDPSSQAIARACGFALEREEDGVTWWRR